MARKSKPKSTSDVVGRATSALLECPLTADEIRSLTKIEKQRQEAEIEQRYAVTEEQKRKAYAKAAKAGEGALALMERVSARREASWSAAALQEIDALAKNRGEDLEGDKAGARVRVAPLARLYRGYLIDEAQYEAGKLYGETWRRLYGGKNGEGTGNGTLDPLESRISDLKRLDAARGYDIADVGGRVIVSTGLGGDARLVKICDDICGRELSLREVVLGNASGALSIRRAEGETDEKAKVRVSGHQRKVAMERLRHALGLLALHYGLTKTREDELKAA